jgi:hypothetical protein
VSRWTPTAAPGVIDIRVHVLRTARDTGFVPVSNAYVFVLTGAQRRTAGTDSLGVAHLENVVSGTHTVIVMAVGYNRGRSDTLVVTAGRGWHGEIGLSMIVRPSCCRPKTQCIFM